MATTTSNNTRIATVRDDRRLTSDVAMPRARNEQTAQRLTLVAMRQWEKALTGIVAVPAAAALSAAAGAMFVASLCERTFEMIESAVADMGARVGEEFDAHGDLRDLRDGRDGRDAMSWSREPSGTDQRS